MNNYVYIDSNNGHYKTYFNFISDATKEQILELIKRLRKEDHFYGRVGMSVAHLQKHLNEDGFKCHILENDRKRQYIDRIPIKGISGNY